MFILNKSVYYEKQKCTIENCDIFDFMAKHVGLTVIHPGGFNATRMLAESCHLDETKKVIDIACGKGTSAIFFAQKCACKVIGIDISEELPRQRCLQLETDCRIKWSFELVTRWICHFPGNAGAGKG